MQTLQNILYGLGIGLFTIFFFGLCVFVHELGHLLVALWRGLTPEKFSVGFGKKIWGFTRGGVEYQVSMIPFGGYVALPQLDPSDTEPETSDGRKLPFAKPLDRALVALAGPAANIVFGFFLALFVWWFGVYAPPPIRECEVAKLEEKSPDYQAGLRVGDRIITINGESFSSQQMLLEKFILSTKLTPKDPRSKAVVELGVRRDGKDVTITYVPARHPDREDLGCPSFLVFEPPVVGETILDSPAAHAGIQAQDLILSTNGAIVRDVSEFMSVMRKNGAAPVTIELLRDGKKVTVSNLVPRAGKDGFFKAGISFVMLTHPNPWMQFVSTFTRTRDTLRALVSPKSSVSFRHMSGPIGILQATGINVYLGGLRKGLDFIVMVCFSLAIFNLFPVPVLDGGHIMIAGIEGVSRRRIPAKLAEYVQTAFAVLLIGFMLYVTVFDIIRTPKLWKRFFGTEKAVPVKVEQKAVPEMKPAAVPETTPTK